MGRFIIGMKERPVDPSSSRELTIYVDTLTGVQYLYSWQGNSGGLTVLVDKQGKPLLDAKYAK